MGHDAELKYSHLDDDDHISLLPREEASYYSSSKKTSAWPIILPWSLVCVLVGALVWLTSQYPRQAGDPSQAVYSPAQSQIEYHNSTFVRAFGRQLSEYQGWPSADIDQKWDNLYDRGVLVGISAEDNARLPNPSVNVPQPGREAEYLVGFDVFHQLHCLNLIRKSMYPRRYNISMVVADGRVHYGRWMHLDHCIESLRQSLMCHSDISTIYYKWLPKSKNLQPMLGGVHTCRNFSKIRDWAWERSVEIPDIHRHVENGKIVAFSPDWDKNFDLEDPAWNAPDGWAYTAEDL